ncbi:MAG: helix-turn-helix domain-containing protein, partial [Planctomycetota bacterium]
MVNPERPDKGDRKRKRRQKPRADRPDLDEASLELLTLLRKRREELGMTIYDLAKRAGISPSYVSLLENGRQVPNARLAMRIASALDLHRPLKEAYEAWVDLRRHDTATGAFEAAHKLRGAWSTLEREYPHLAEAGRLWFQEMGESYGATLNAAGAPEMGRARRRHAGWEREGATEAGVLRVPVVAEGRELRTPKVRVREWLA